MVDTGIIEAPPVEEYANSRYILDGGADKLLHQTKQWDDGELNEIARKFPVIFVHIDEKYLGFLVHKAFIPYLGNVIGELIKIQFPVKNEEPVEWMARISAVKEKNLNQWWEKGFDEKSADEVCMVVETQNLPLNRVATIRKVLKAKFKKVKLIQRITFGQQILLFLRNSFIKIGLFTLLANFIMVGVLFLLSETLGEFIETMTTIKTKVEDSEILKENQLGLSIQDQLKRFSFSGTVPKKSFEKSTEQVLKDLEKTKFTKEDMARLENQLRELANESVNNQKLLKPFKDKIDEHKKNLDKVLEIGDESKPN